VKVSPRSNRLAAGDGLIENIAEGVRPNGEAEAEYGKPLIFQIANPERLLTVQEVADWLRVKPAWVRAHANGNRKPKLPSVKLGAHRRFRREAVARFIEE
jgi:excisionase family DNA binding protein